MPNSVSGPSLMAAVAQATTVQLRARKDELENEMHGRLINWGRWASGGCFPAGPMRRGSEPIEADALEVESAMLSLKRHRPQHYRVVFERYVKRYSDFAIGQGMRKTRWGRVSEARVKQLMREAFHWLHARLA